MNYREAATDRDIEAKNEKEIVWRKGHVVNVCKQSKSV